MADTAIVKCNSCGAIYKPTQSDGTVYYHACADQHLITSVVVDPTSGAVIKPAVFAPVANRRDENVQHLDAAGNVVIKREGAGVTPVFDPAVIAAAGL